MTKYDKANEQKAKEIMNKFYGNLMPHYTHNEVFNRCFRARYADILEAMQWKDEQEIEFLQSLMFQSATYHIFDRINERIKLLKGE